MGKPNSLIEFTKDRPGHDQRYAINASKIKKQLGWKPGFTFNEGIALTITHYLENKNKYLPKVAQR